MFPPNQNKNPWNVNFGATNGQPPAVSGPGVTSGIGTGAPGQNIASGTGLPASGAPSKSALDAVMGILNTPAGAALISAGGAGISAYGANKQAEAGREQNAQQFAASTAQRQLENDQNHQQNAAIAGANASPLGAEQLFAQRNGLLGAIMGNTRNFSATPGDPRVAAAMGSTNQGGMRIPEGGFDPAMLERLFGDKSTMESIANRQQTVGQINPRATPLNLSTMYGDQGATATAGVMGANQTELDRQLAESTKQREIIQRAIDEDIRGSQQPAKKEGGGNIFGKILKGAGSVAGFIPGIGQIAAPILSGVGGIVNGDGLKSSLINAGMSAIPGLAQAGKLGGTVAQFAKKPIGQAIMGGLR